MTGNLCDGLLLTAKYELLPVPTLIDDVRLAISHFEGSLS